MQEELKQIHEQVCDLYEQVAPNGPHAIELAQVIEMLRFMMK